jgi:hypothetical protein
VPSSAHMKRCCCDEYVQYVASLRVTSDKVLDVISSGLRVLFALEGTHNFISRQSRSRVNFLGGRGPKSRELPRGTRDRWRWRRSEGDHILFYRAW